jgi:hypothetical protein
MNRHIPAIMTQRTISAALSDIIEPKRLEN